MPHFGMPHSQHIIRLQHRGFGRSHETVLDRSARKLLAFVCRNNFELAILSRRVDVFRWVTFTHRKEGIAIVFHLHCLRHCQDTRQAKAGLSDELPTKIVWSIRRVNNSSLANNHAVGKRAEDTDHEDKPFQESSLIKMTCTRPKPGQQCGDLGVSQAEFDSVLSLPCPIN